MKKNLQQFFKEGADCLSAAGIAEAELDAKYLLMWAFKIDTVHFLMERQTLLDENDCKISSKVEQYKKAIKARADRVPMQYIIGTQEFMGLEFLVNENVLIPRQDTETLVESVLNDFDISQKKVLDLCTGSGCIAVSLAKIGKCAQVTAVDISEKALEIAKQNAERNGMDIKFIHSNMFENIATGEKFDMIVSNPPYIETDVIQGLSPEVRDHEPMLALDGEKDGLKFYRLIAEKSKDYLNDGGSVYLEIGYNQAEAVSTLLKDAGFYDIKVQKDAPGLDRVVKARC